MKTIIVSTQKEYDSIKDKENFRIEIRNAKEVICVKNKEIVYLYDSSTVYANGSSTVYAYDSSKVYAYHSSKVYAYHLNRVHAHDSSDIKLFNYSFCYSKTTKELYAYQNSMAFVYEPCGLSAYDNSVVNKMDIDFELKHKDKYAKVVKTKTSIPTFEDWLSRGYVSADGILKELISHKKNKSIDVFKVKEKDGTGSFVIKSGEIFSHGKTLKEAKDSLIYKISNRDTSMYKSWKLTDTKKTTDLIKAYRAITGACESETRNFCESRKLKTKYKISEIIELTKGKYGNEQFKKFFKG